MLISFCHILTYYDGIGTHIFIYFHIFWSSLAVWPILCIFWLSFEPFSLLVSFSCIFQHILGNFNYLFSYILVIFGHLTHFMHILSMFWAFGPLISFLCIFNIFRAILINLGPNFMYFGIVRTKVGPFNPTFDIVWPICYLLGLFSTYFSQFGYF